MPSSKTHFVLGLVAFGVGVWLATQRFSITLTQAQLMIGLLIAIIASQFPDIDSGQTNIAELFYSLFANLIIGGIAYAYFSGDQTGNLLSAVIGIIFFIVLQLKHRGITHSHQMAIGTAILFGLVFPFYGLIWFLGYESHLIPDSLSGQGKYL